MNGKTSIGLALGLSLSLLSACATVVTPQERNRPLQMALDTSVDEIRQKAEEGDRPSQYALSFLMKYGLRGVDRDPVAAEVLRAQAGRNITTYQSLYTPPSTKGGTGSVTNATHISPGISDIEARRLDLCGGALLLAQPALGGQLCGSPEAYAELLTVTAPLRADLLAGRGLEEPVDVDPASVTDCAQTRELWMTAARNMGVAVPDRLAKAAAASQRIIDLCGEDEASWHARVMRAKLHLMADEPEAVPAILVPLPIPAPHPIGSFGALTLMKAQSRLEDWSGASQTREALVAASIAALSSEAGGRLVDRFETKGGTVSLFERKGRGTMGVSFLRVAVVQSSAPQSVMVGYALSRSDMGENSRYYLDEYRCDGRGTMRTFETQPDDGGIRDLILQRQAGELELLTFMSKPTGPVCLWPALVAPGLGDDPTIRFEYSSQPAD